VNVQAMHGWPIIDGTLDRQVKGVLFVDYVRMVRSQKGLDWSAHLRPDDLPYLKSHIDPNGWYPMTTFERMGNAILRVIARGNLDVVRMFGRFSVDQLRAAQPMLLSPGNPVETLHRFRVLRSTFFNFEALEVLMLHDDEAHIAIRYHMGPIAEEAAAHQTMGFFERLLELADAKDVTARFRETAWTGAPRTFLALSWTSPSS
jgi:hypothetical protein